MDEINVEKIMEEIRSRLPEEQAAWEAVRFEDMPREGEGMPLRPVPGGPFSPERLQEETEHTAAYCQVAFFRPLEGGLKGFCKRAVRKLIRFCVEPIALEVSRFNAAAAAALESLRRFVREKTEADRRRDEELAALRRQVAALEERLRQAEREQA